MKYLNTLKDSTGSSVWTGSNDGTGSGLDADLLDGLSSASFARALDATVAQINTVLLLPGIYRVESEDITNLPGNYFYIYHSGPYSGGGYCSQIAIPFTGGTNEGMYLRVASGSTWGNWVKLAVNATDVGLGNVNNTTDALKPVSTATQTALNLKLDISSYTASDILTKLKTVDGAGSGLDADLLDGLSSSQFLRSDISNTITGTLTASNGDATYGVSPLPSIELGTNLTKCGSIKLWGTTTSAYGSVHMTTNNLHIDPGATPGRIYLNFYAGDGVIFGNGASSIVANMDINGQLWKGSSKYWHDTNDGSGSGLDADLLEGYHAAFVNAANTIPIRDGNGNIASTSNTVGTWTIKENADGSLGFFV